MNTDLVYVGAAVLNAEQAAVVRYIIIQELTESQAAVLLTEISGRFYTRDRVHRIRLTSIAKMRRAIEAHLATAAIAA